MFGGQLELGFLDLQTLKLNPIHVILVIAKNKGLAISIAGEPVAP
jgi:hypothetical protein